MTRKFHIQLAKKFTEEGISARNVLNAYAGATGGQFPEMYALACSIADQKVWSATNTGYFDMVSSRSHMRKGILTPNLWNPYNSPQHNDGSGVICLGLQVVPDSNGNLRSHQYIAYTTLDASLSEEGRKEFAEQTMESVDYSMLNSDSLHELGLIVFYDALGQKPEEIKDFLEMFPSLTNTDIPSVAASPLNLPYGMYRRAGLLSKE